MLLFEQKIYFLHNVWNIKNHLFFPEKKRRYIKHICRLNWYHIHPNAKFIIIHLVLPFLISRYNENIESCWLPK